MWRVKCGWLVLCIVSSGCAPDRAGAGATGGVDTSVVGGIIKLRAAELPVLRIRASPEVIVGREELGTEHALGKVWDVETDQSGSLYVLDVMRQEVLRFDSMGRFLNMVGRAGAGPGEFRWPARLIWVGDTLGVWDVSLMRLTLFTPEGRVLRDSVLPQWRDVQEVVWTNAGFVVQIGPSWRWPVTATDGIALLVRSAERFDTLHSWSDSLASVAYRAPGVSSVAAVPFAPRQSWMMQSDGSFVFANGSSFHISYYDKNGQLTKQVTRTYKPAPPSEAEVREARENVDRMDARLRKMVTLPRVKPAINQLLVDRTGRVLARTSTADDRKEHQWDVIGCTGAYIAALIVPANVLLMHVSRTALIGIESDSLDIQRVVKLSYRVPRSEDSC
ncbi:MAG: 6-bladed beta-propeller [Gemmatimonadota bacterium]